MSPSTESNCAAPFFAIDRLRMGTDGHGVTTLVCFMGCPLRCAYCINDTCHDKVFETDGITPHSNIRMLTPKQLYDHVKIDDLYFQATGGGICFGGGEPSQHVDFITEFRKLCGNSWRLTIETSLYGCSYADMKRLASVIDLWIVDIKDLNDDVYLRYTGRKSHITQCLAWLRQLDLTDNVIVKLPVIPDYNNEDDVRNNATRLRQQGFTHVTLTHFLKRLSKYPPNKQHML